MTESTKIKGGKEMSIVQVDRYTPMQVREFQGLAEDLNANGKPEIILESNNTGSTFHVVDAGTVFNWHIDQWYEI